jgi:hypothetical protein
LCILGFCPWRGHYRRFGDGIGMLEQLLKLLDRLDALLARFPDGFWARGLDAAESGIGGLLWWGI